VVTGIFTSAQQVSRGQASRFTLRVGVAAHGYRSDVIRFER
jgi:hypothetical protein